MRSWVRAATAVAVLGATLATPQSALACSGPMPTRDEAIGAASLIIAGTIASKPGGWAYELEVEEVFRGPQSGTIVIGDLAPTTAPVCSHQLEVGDRVVVALREPTNLGLFSSAVWILLPDGTVGTLAAEPPAATHEELFAFLRLLPDTSMPIERGPGPLFGTSGVALLAAGVGIGVLRGIRQRAARGDAVGSYPAHSAAGRL